jgi:hypothetical protein
MLCFHNSVLINRSIEDVYRFIAVDFFENYQKWSPEVCELEQLTCGEMRVGVTGRQVRYDRGYRSEAYFRVTAMMPLRDLPACQNPNLMSATCLNRQPLPLGLLSILNSNRRY